MEVRTALDPKIIESLVITGDLSQLGPLQKVAFYNYKCQQAGLDPAAKPFDLLTLNNKQILYANAGCSQQLTANRKLSHSVTNRELVEGIYCVFVKVTDQDGRSTENMGAVPVEGLKGEPKANAMLKATTKAIRRAVLAHCGLGMMDEEEVRTIPGAVEERWTSVSPVSSTETPLPTTISNANGWDVESLGDFEAILDRAYTAFKSASQPLEAYNEFAAKWKAARNANGPTETLAKIEEVVKKLEGAAIAVALKAGKGVEQPA